MGDRLTAGPRRPSIVALVLVTGISPLATDSYISALPALRRSLHTTPVLAQLTITAFIVGIALGQLTLGPLSDSIGRRGPLLVSTTMFALMSVVCAVAPDAVLLVGARFVQGLVAGCSVAVGRAVVGDHWHGVEAAHRYGTITSIIYLAPVVAPALGGLVLTFGTWRTIFVGLALVGLIMVLAAVIDLPESLPPQDRHGGGLRHLLGRMSDLIGDWSFMQHVCIACLMTAGFFTYIGGSSFVLETVYGLSATTYALLFAVNAAGMAVTSVVFRLAVRRAGAARLRTIGMSVALVGAAILVVLAVVERTDGLPPLALTWAALSVTTAGIGLVTPATLTLAQEAGRRARGSASALQGGLTFFVGALVTPLTGIVGYRSMLPMAVFMACFFALAMTVLLSSCRPSGRRRCPRSNRTC